MARRDGFKNNERITRDGLNKKLTAPAAINLSGPRVNKRRGDVVLTDEEEIFIRITGTATGPRRYAWQEVSHERDTGTWKNTNRTGSIDSDPAYELNNAVLSSGSTVFTARRSRSSGNWTFDKGSGGGNVNIRSNETVLMILGEWTDYELCPNAPPDPPMTFANPGCDDTTRTTTPCVPAYAFAVYQRCGYVWNKVGDSRTYQVWATELNGGSTSSWYRFAIPRWGGDIDPVTLLPDPDSECMGVAFVNPGVGALSCSCPAWLSGVECLKIRVKWIPEPASKPVGCPQACWDEMADRWGTEEVGEILNEFGGCLFQGDVGFGVSLNWVPIADEDCFWGPSVFDPCDPCAGFGTIVLGINSGTGVCGSPSNFWMGYRVNEQALRGLICDCDSGPLRITEHIGPVGRCGHLAEWVEIECCDPPPP